MKSRKTAVSDRQERREGGVSWSEVLGVLQEDSRRDRAMLEFREAGFRPDDWWQRQARVAMAEILIGIEDSLEYEGIDLRARRAAKRAAKLDRERAKIGKVRRHLEQELWS